MKTILRSIILTLFIGNAYAQTAAPVITKEKAIETAILWTAERDASTWSPVAMSKYVNDGALFEKQGNFYKPKQKLVIFGYEALYVGMIGVENVTGPNATLKGTPKQIAATLTKEYGLKFNTSEDEWVCDYNEKLKVKLVIIAHPSIKNTSILIGAYLGE